jgi:hypothetical protein
MNKQVKTNKTIANAVAINATKRDRVAIYGEMNK